MGWFVYRAFKALREEKASNSHEAHRASQKAEEEALSR
jgi:hypothetical protein